MKIVFSTKNVSRASFLDTCRYAFDYGFEGFEIYDAVKERSYHHDSILRRDRIADAKRKLVNRNLAVSALRMPDSVDSENVTSDIVVKYVDMAAASGISNVIVSIGEKASFDALGFGTLALWSALNFTIISSPCTIYSGSSVPRFLQASLIF